MIAIQTPHGSLLNIFQQKQEEQVPARYYPPSLMQDREFPQFVAYLRDSYHLEIDAESGRVGLPDENITIYQVDAPVTNKKENQKEAP